MADCPFTGARSIPALEQTQAEAREYLNQLRRENVVSAREHALRAKEIEASIAATGTYRHTQLELEYGAMLAWRNASRCIGRLYWESLLVRDLRHVRTAQRMFDELVAHLRLATNGGRIRSTISVFAPRDKSEGGPRIWNTQLIRYAGYRQPDGSIVGDPAQAEFTDRPQVPPRDLCEDNGPAEIVACA